MNSITSSSAVALASSIACLKEPGPESKVNAVPQTDKGSSTDKPEECDDSLLEDAAFDDISKISSTMGLVDESTPCLNGVSPDSMLEELAFYGEINWAGLALSTLTLSQFPTFSKDKSKRLSKYPKLYSHLIAPQRLRCYHLCSGMFFCVIGVIELLCAILFLGPFR